MVKNETKRRQQLILPTNTTFYSHRDFSLFCKIIIPYFYKYLKIILAFNTISLWDTLVWEGRKIQAKRSIFWGGVYCKSLENTVFILLLLTPPRKISSNKLLNFLTRPQGAGNETNSSFCLKTTIYQ